MRSGCCARAANGHAAAEPQTSFMNSRRLITPSTVGQTIVSGGIDTNA
jgi:hypothetical protein